MIVKSIEMQMAYNSFISEVSSDILPNWGYRRTAFRYVLFLLKFLAISNPFQFA